MEKIKGRELPPNLTQIRSLEPSLHATWNARANMLSQFHGYPEPGQIVNLARAYLDISSRDKLKAGIMKLRDCAYLASKAIIDILAIRLDKYVLNQKDIIEYLDDTLPKYSAFDVSPADKEFIAQLIVSFEVQDVNWLLDLSDLKSENMYCRFQNLYSECNDISTPSGSFEKKKLTVNPTSIAGMAQYYDPEKKSLSPLSSFITSSERFATAELNIANMKNGSSEQAKAITDVWESMRSEEIMYNLADVRMIDHVFCLFMDLDIWRAFITPKTKKDDAQQNFERSKGLSTLSSYLHSLLIYPHIFRFELFKTSYEKLEIWQGSFPFIAEHVMLNYNKFIRDIDFLGAKEDALSLSDAYQSTKDDNLGVAITVQFMEMVEIYGVADKIKTIVDKPLPSRLALKDSYKLKEPSWSYIIDAVQLADLMIFEDTAARRALKYLFSNMVDQAVLTIAKDTNLFYSPEAMDRLVSLNIKVPFKFHGYISASYYYKKAALFSFTKGKLNFRYYAVMDNAELTRTMRNEEVYIINTASEIVSTRSEVAVGYDEDLAAKFRSSMMKEWGGYFPSDLFQGESILERTQFANSPLQVESFLSRISGENYSIIRTNIEFTGVKEPWATNLSSCALLYYRDPVNDTYHLISGYGMPYGQTYQELANLQGALNPKEFISIPGTALGLVFLKRIPMPTHVMDVGTMYLLTPYYYFKGNGIGRLVDRFTTGPGLLHMAMRPVIPITEKPGYLFDKLHVYLNDTLAMQNSRQFSFEAEHNPQETFSFPIQLKKWVKEKNAINLEWWALSPYSSVSDKAGVEVGETNETLTARLIAEQEAALKSAIQNTPVNKPATPVVIPSLDIQKKKIEEPSSNVDHKKTVSPPHSPTGIKNDEEDDIKKNNVIIPIGHFDIEGNKIEVKPGDGESDDQAIARVAAAHNVDITKFVKA